MSNIRKAGPSTADAEVLNGIRDALETRGYFHMANGRDIGLLLDEAARSAGAAQPPSTADAEREWARLNAVFHKALQEYPYSQHALHYFWNNAIATGSETMRRVTPPPAPPLVASTYSLCAKCGCETKGEAALVDGKIWCHPCADARIEALDKDAGK